MSTSKTRFQQPRSISPSKGSKIGLSSRSSAGSTSKKVGAVAATAASGFVGSTRSSAAQVIFNGKIVTPQSLIPRKIFVGDGQNQAQNLRKARENAANAVHTIDESAPENQEKALTKNRKFDGSRMTAFGSNLVIPGTKKVEDEVCVVRISETHTNMILSIPSFISASDTRDAIFVDERNNRYDAIIASHKNTEGFVSKPTQTFNYALKNQNDMAAPNTFQEFGCQVTTYEINDAMEKETAIESSNSSLGAISHSTSSGTDTMDLDDIMGFTSDMKKMIRDSTSAALVSSGCLLDTSDVVRTRNPGESSDTKNKSPAKKPKSVMTSSFAVQTARSTAGGDSVDDRGVSGNVVPLASGADVSGHGSSSNNNIVQGSTVNASVVVSDSGADVSGNIASGSVEYAGAGEMGYSEQDTKEILRQKEAEAVLSSPLLLKRLMMMERAIQQNAYHRKHLDYRDLPDIPPLSLVSSDRVTVVESSDQLFGGFGMGNSRKTVNTRGGTKSNANSHHGFGRTAAGASSTASLGHLEQETHDKNSKVKKLFSFYNSDLIKGRAVTAMAWNAINSDLLAVGYGNIHQFVDSWTPGKALDESNQDGYVLFWSLRNPDYPERVLRTPRAVTALDFSKRSPTLLAVGFINGDVNFYDVRQEGDWGAPIESSTSVHGGHTDPVWQMNWVEKGIERFEVLVTVSTDGSVLEWNLKKGLAVTKLMQLKRNGVVEGWISREASGLCFDFCPSDSNCYIAGTEEGSVHRCSVSYNEQFLETYQSHDGPVYRVRFSDRWPSVFLTCSADWSLNLYHLNSKNPWLKFKVTGEDYSVNDICWCPGNSTVFASVNSNAVLHIWDLSESIIDPVAVVDTNVDEELIALLSQTSTGSIDDNARGSSSQASMPVTPGATMKRFDRFSDSKEENKEPPVAKLINSITSSKPKRELTCVRFGLTSPTIAIGDNMGGVVIYRVMEPVTILHEGPLQQLQRLKSNLISVLDPSQLEMLQTIPGEML